MPHKKKMYLIIKGSEGRPAPLGCGLRNTYSNTLREHVFFLKILKKYNNQWSRSARLVRGRALINISKKKRHSTRRALYPKKISGSPGLSGGTFLSFFVMATSR